MGPVGVEDAWRPADLAALPHPGSARASAVTVALDEILCALGEEGDRLITAFDLPAEFVEVTRSAGFPARPAGSSLGQPDVLARTRSHAGALRQDVAGLTLKPYAVRAEYAGIASALRVAYEAPATECAVRVNSKTWSNELTGQRGWNGAAWRATSLEELGQRVLAQESAVLLKDPYGVSGQGIVAIRSAAAYRSIARYLAGQVARGRRIELLVQPLFDKLVDVSSHWHVRADGTFRCLGCLVNRVDGFGYQGSGPLEEDTVSRDERRRIESAGTVVCQELVKAGYFGYVSVDGLITRDRTLVPCLEVNARVCMGTVALELMRRAARHNLLAALEFVGVRCDGTASRFAQLVSRLDDARLLPAAGQPGVLPLTANTFDGHEHGRLVLGVFHRPGEAGHLVREALAVACSAGVHPNDRRFHCAHAKPLATAR